MTPARAVVACPNGAPVLVFSKRPQFPRRRDKMDGFPIRPGRCSSDTCIAIRAPNRDSFCLPDQRVEPTPKPGHAEDRSILRPIRWFGDSLSINRKQLATIAMHEITKGAFARAGERYDAADLPYRRGVIIDFVPRHTAIVGDLDAAAPGRSCRDEPALQHRHRMNVEDLRRWDGSHHPALTVGDGEITPPDTPARVLGGPIEKAERGQRIAAVLAEQMALVTHRS